MFLKCDFQFFQMKLLAAYFLLVLGGKEAPTAEEVTAVIAAAGGEVDEDSIGKLFADLEGKDIHELLSKGETDLKSIVSVGGGGGGGGEFKISNPNLNSLFNF